MKKIILTLMEENKYNIIKELVDHSGNKRRAALKLNCSIRTINRLITRYKSEGKSSFSHGNRGRLPSNTFSLETKNKIIELYLNEYLDANITHFSEIVQMDLGISISDTTIRNWLSEHDVLSPKAHRKTKKQLKERLTERLDQTTSTKVRNVINGQIESIEDDTPHSRRSRSKYMGEMIQMDASSYEWIPGEIWHLHLAVDDATGTAVGAYFDIQETLRGYYNVFHQILVDYGIPALFYTDKRTVFEYRKKTKAFDDEDTFTQFSYACHNLGVEIKTTSIAQAKGRIERLNQTFQSRLPVELRRARITCMADANKFLKSYLKEFNARFALHLNSTNSVFEVQPDIETINQTLAIISSRIVDQGNCIKFKNKYWMAYDKEHNRIPLRPKMEVLVIESFEQKIFVNAMDTLYILEEVPVFEENSAEFDNIIETPEKKKVYIPPISHPWRKYSYQLFTKKQNYYSSANVR